MMSIRRIVAVATLVGCFVPGAVTAGEEQKTKSIYGFTVKDNLGEDVSLSKFKGDVVLIVNVASRCGLTQSNYAGLVELYKKYEPQGLKILAFPANNFGKQEPRSDKQIRKFCDAKKVSFDLFSKVSVKGEDQCPLYQYLTQHPDNKVAGEVQWNFQKYLVGRNGTVLAKFNPRVKPTDSAITSAIDQALAQETTNGKG